MKKITMRILTLLMALVMLFLVACGAPAEQEPTTEETPATTDEPATEEAPANDEYMTSLGLYPLIAEPDMAPEASQSTEEKITLTVWMSPMWTVTDEALTNGDTVTMEHFLQETLGRFAASYTGADVVEVVVENVPGKDRDEKLAVAAATGTLPDLIYESFFAVSSYAHQGVFVPIDDIIDDTAKSDIPQTVWDQVQINNQTYCYPFTQGLNFLGYNADMFREAGLDDYIAGENEMAHWTNDEFTEILTAIDENLDVTPFVVGSVSANGDTWLLKQIRSMGGEWFDADGNFIANNPETVAGLQYLVDLKDSGLINSDPESIQGTESREQFVNQLSAVGIMANANYNTFKNNMASGELEEFDIRAAYMYGTEPTVSSYVHGLSVFNTQDEVRMTAAKDYVKWLNSNDAFLAESRWLIPVRDTMLSEYADFDVMFPAYQEASQYAINFSNNSPNYTELRNVLYPQIQAAFTGVKTPQQAMDDYVAEANEILATAREESVALN